MLFDVRSYVLILHLRMKMIFMFLLLGSSNAADSDVPQRRLFAQDAVDDSIPGLTSRLKYEVSTLCYGHMWIC